MSPLDDEMVEALKRPPQPRDLDAVPDPTHPGYIVVPDSDPESWNSLDDFERETEEMGITFEEWGALEQEAEDG